MVIKEKGKSEILFRIFNIGLMIFLTVITLFPFLHVVAKAFSVDTAILSGEVLIWPVKPQLNAFEFIIKSNNFLRSFLNSVFLVIMGTTVSMVLTILTAYPLSKQRLKGRKFLTLFFVFTMLFSGGIVPLYLLRNTLGLIDTYWAIILPGILVFYMLIFKNFFEQVPEALEESAMLDGAGNFRILFSIYLPLSLPSIATVGLFYAVWYWNQYFSPMMYLQDTAKYPLQLYLRSVIHMASLSDVEKSAMDADVLMNVATESVVAATVVASTVPILILYPFLQKYFVKGVTIGSVKG